MQNLAHPGQQGMCRAAVISAQLSAEAEIWLVFYA